MKMYRNSSKHNAVSHLISIILPATATRAQINDSVVSIVVTLQRWVSKTEFKLVLIAVKPTNEPPP